MSFGLMLPTVDAADAPSDPWRCIDAAERAEAAGFDSVHVGDHVLHPGQILESVVALAVVAARTTSVALGPCVLLPALRKPAAIAKQLATLACFARNRLQIGVGVGGEFPGEWTACDVPMAERGKRTEEAVIFLRSVLGGQGDEGLQIRPVPDSDTPILFAGRREPALRRAARLGDGWIGYLQSPEGFARSCELLRRERAELGVHGDFSFGLLVPCLVTDRDDRVGDEVAAALMRLAKRPDAVPSKYVIAGTPERFVEALHRYRMAGCQQLILSPLARGERWPQQLARLCDDVLPALRGA